MTKSSIPISWIVAGLMLGACGSDPALLTPSGQTYLRLYDGNDQYVRLGGKPQFPFKVRVTDADFRPVPNVEIRWRVEVIEGTLLSDPGGQPLANPVTVTDQLGYSSVSLLSSAAGLGNVVATADGHIGSPATFTLTVVHPLDVYVQFWPDFECPGPAVFLTPDRSGDIVITLGGTLLLQYGNFWLDHRCRARIVSVSEPPGGRKFDSDSMVPSEVYRFTPNVAGTWQLLDALNGGRGTLTARIP